MYANNGVPPGGRRAWHELDPTDGKFKKKGWNST